MAYTKPQQRKKEESNRLREERDPVKFIDFRCKRWQVAILDLLHGTYTRMLCAVLNKPWQHHPTLKELYGVDPLIADVIKEMR